ncbi:MAG: hypothetical protein QW247_07720 [Pyrobaculum sp.]
MAKSGLKIGTGGIYLVALLAVFSAYSAVLTSELPRVYTITDLFGPLTQLSAALTAVALAAAVSYSAVTLARIKASTALLVLAYIIAVFSKFLVPIYLDTNYITNFNDAQGHMIRGIYVTLTGHSNPLVDGYFDLQPGFFWWTAIFIDVLWGPQTSVVAPPFQTLITFFPLFAMVITTPILYVFFRRLGFDTKISWALMTLTIVLWYDRAHYSAQVYTYALYWLSLAIILMVLHGERKAAWAFGPIGVSVIFLHEGTTLFIILALLGATLYAIWNREAYRRATFSLPAMLTFLTVSWLLRLKYNTIWTFSNFVSVFNTTLYVYILQRLGIHVFIAALGAVSALLVFLFISRRARSAINKRAVMINIAAILLALVVIVYFSNIIERDLVRAYLPWEHVVMAKSVYYGALILLTLFILGLHRRLRPFAPVTWVLLFASGAVAFALGGAGYAERLYQISLPLVAVALLTVAAKLPIRMSAVIIAIAAVPAFLFYFAGWNFQSVQYSEYYPLIFFVAYSPSTGPYSKLPVLPNFFLINNNINLGAYYNIAYGNYLEVMYYYKQSYIINKINTYLLTHGSLIYNSGSYKLVKPVG